MRLALVGAVIGIAIAVTLLFATSGSETVPAKVETDRQNAALTVGKCDDVMKTLGKDLEKALKDPATRRQQVSQMLAVHEEVCTKAAAAVRTAREARPDSLLDVAITRMDHDVERLRKISVAFAAYEVALGSAALAGSGSAGDAEMAGAGSAELRALSEAAH